jgi:hypothetical protein
MGHVIQVVTPCTGNTTLTAAIGPITPVDDFDTLVTTVNMMGTAGYYAGTAGDALDTTNTDASLATYGGAQLTVTVQPDSGSKVSQCTVGKVNFTVWFLDGTGT